MTTSTQSGDLWKYINPMGYHYVPRRFKRINLKNNLCKSQIYQNFYSNTTIKLKSIIQKYIKTALGLYEISIMPRLGY